MTDKDKRQAASQDDIDALLAEVQAGAAAATGPTSKTGVSTEAIIKDDIDALLAEITKSSDGQKPKAASDKSAKREADSAAKTQDAPAPQTGSLKLTPGDLHKLVAKHAGNDALPPETMISQEDIDALVNQLGAAVGGEAVPLTASIPKAGTRRLSGPMPNPSATASTYTDLPQPPMEAMGKRAPAPAPAPAAKAGAAPSAKPASRFKPALGSSSATVAVLPAPGLIPVMAPAELRGARWLLVAAVVLLAICALAMGAVVKTVAGLSRELSRKDVDSAIDADQFALMLTAARSQLSSSDESEVVLGVERLKQLRERFPTRTFELTLELARHWRSHGFHRKAADEYATIIDRVVAQPSDPRLLLEDAECLAQVGENDEAVRLLYVLLAHERIYLTSDDSMGHPRPAEDVNRDRLAVQQAYLLLGDLLSRPATVTTTSKPAPADKAVAHAPEGH